LSLLDGEGELAAAWTLPRGRHGLAPEYVAAHQRARLLRAVCELCAERGYAETTVSRIVRRASVAQRTFYRHFDGKEACFLAAWEGAAAELEQRVLAAVGAGQAVAQPGAQAPARGPAERERGRGRSRRVVLALRVLLEELAAHPALARTLFVDVLFAGPRALRSRERVLESCRAALPAPPAGAPAQAAEAALGGVVETIYHTVLVGEAATLPAIGDELAYCLLCPLVGHEQALVAVGGESAEALAGGG
jgi:AcrR family transcriptional regulator